MNQKLLESLVKTYGEVNVEDTMIYVTNAKDQKGLAVNIPMTRDRILTILEAVHGEFLNEKTH